jgi:serine/threonine protein kinase
MLNRGSVSYLSPPLFFLLTRISAAAPEIYMCSCEEYGISGYGFAVDWWSLGILAWETLAVERPYPLHSTTSNREALRILQVSASKNR